MEKEENVYEQNTQTEEVAKANGAAAQEKEETSAVLGKFKDVNALARAYGALEAEFTRRSQRLKELEYQLSNNSQKGNEAAAAGAEKLRTHAKARKEAAKAFEEFVSSVGKAHTDGVAARELGVDTALEETQKGSDDILKTQKPCLEDKAKEGGMYALKEENTLAAKPEGEGNATEYKVETAGLASTLSMDKGGADEESVSKGENVFSAVAKHGNTEISSEELYRRVSRDEGVRLKIIGEYLASIGKSGAPMTAAGAGVPISPPLKAKNIADAGVMALQFLKQSY